MSYTEGVKCFNEIGALFIILYLGCNKLYFQQRIIQECEEHDTHTSETRECLKEGVTLYSVV